MGGIPSCSQYPPLPPSALILILFQIPSPASNNMSLVLFMCYSSSIKHNTWQVRCHFLITEGVSSRFSRVQPQSVNIKEGDYKKNLDSYMKHPSLYCQCKLCLHLQSRTRLFSPVDFCSFSCSYSIMYICKQLKYTHRFLFLNWLLSLKQIFQPIKTNLHWLLMSIIL